MGCLEIALPLSPQVSPFPLPAWPNPVWISFPLRTCSRSDVSLLSRRIHGYHPLSLSLAPLPLLPIFSLRGLFQTVVLFCSVLSLTFSIFPLFLYFLSIAHCLCEALSWPNAWLRPHWLKAAQGMARLMFSFFLQGMIWVLCFSSVSLHLSDLFFSFRLGCSINMAFGPDPNQIFPYRKLNHWQSAIYWLFPEDELYQIIILCGRLLLCFPPAFFPLYWEVMLICVCLSGWVMFWFNFYVVRPTQFCFCSGKLSFPIACNSKYLLYKFSSPQNQYSVVIYSFMLF